MSLTRKRHICLVAAAVTLLSGCGSDSSDTAASTTPQPALPTTDTPAPSTAAHTNHASTTMSQSSPENCTDAELDVTLGQVNGAAGSTELTLIFTNTGSHTCTLDGFPGVSYVSGPDGTEVGAAATGNGSGSAVSLVPGSTGTAVVRATNVENYPADHCGITDVAGLRVYPPNAYDGVFLAYPTQGCSMTGATINQLTVAPVTG